MNSEWLLATLPGAAENHQLAVYLVRLPDGSSKLALHQQSWAEGIGWYDQKCLELAPEQFRQLRSLAVPACRPGKQLQADGPATLPFPGTACVESA
jgi:hypothetical protein